MNKADFEKVAAALNEMVRALKFEPNMSEEAERASYEHAGRFFISGPRFAPTIGAG